MKPLSTSIPDETFDRIVEGVIQGANIYREHCGTCVTFFARPTASSSRATNERRERLRANDRWEAWARDTGIL